MNSTKQKIVTLFFTLTLFFASYANGNGSGGIASIGCASGSESTGAGNDSDCSMR